VADNTERPASPTVSIGMPVYDGERYIREALDSLLAQTFTDFEFMISDNASTDGTESICREYAAKDSRIHYIRQDKNRGSTNNCRFLLDQAKGKYFMWAACDDYWSPNFISECLSLATSSPDVGFVVTRYRVTSRFSPVFSRYFLPDLSFVTYEDPKERILSYACRPHGTHKDNLVYAFWNKAALTRIVSDVERRLNRVLINGPAHYYALSLYKGAFVNKTLFFKKYAYAVPGHPLNPTVGLVLKSLSVFLKRFKRVGKNQLDKEVLAEAEYLHDAIELTELAGFDDAFISSIVNAHKSYMGKQAFANVVDAEAARDLLADESEERFKDALHKIATRRPKTSDDGLIKEIKNSPNKLEEMARELGQVLSERDE
jgi:glycosyltransferase involved in cell wall biosynthesis